MNKMVDFLYASNDAQNSNELMGRLLAFLKNLGIERFTMAELTQRSTADKEKKFGLMINYPQEWFDRYISSHYVDVDPVYRMALRSSRPFTWDEALEKHNSKAAARVMNEAKEYKLNCGIGMTIHRPYGKIIGCSFSSSEKDVRSDEEVRRMLHIVSFQTYLAFSGMSRSEPPEAIAPAITEREREVLLWVSIGKSKSEIADILAISESCVKRHCESISRKLQTNTLAFAVAKAVKWGLIDPF